MAGRALAPSRFLGIVQDVDLRHLRVFLAVAERGSFSKAGSDLNTSRSTVSIHMADLEKRLGMTLCERRRGHFRLTEQGHIVFKAARELFAELERFRGQVNSAHERLAGELKIGYLDQLSSHPEFPLVSSLRNFKIFAPQVKIMLRVSSLDEIERGVESGSLDIGVIADYHHLSGLNYRDFFIEEQKLYCGLGHHLFNRPDSEIDNGSIANCEFAMSGYVNPKQLPLPGIDVKIGATAYSAEALAHLILTGNYVAFLPAHYAERWINQGAMRALSPKTFTINRPFRLITKAGREMEKVLERFVRELLSK